MRSPWLKLKAWFAVLVALSLFAAPAFARGANTQVDAPALWTVKSAKGKVYLFGSVHILPSNVAWRSAAVDKALNEAKVVVFELDLAKASEPQRLQQMIAQYGLLPQGRTLKNSLSTQTYAELERVCADLGVAPAQLDAGRPWFAALTLSMQAIAKLGFNPANGVDFKIYSWAKSKGKKVAALETLESQIAIFGDLTPEEELQYLDLTLQEADKVPKVLGEMLAAYRVGDTIGLDRTINSGFEGFPRLRTRLLKERNANWVPQIEAMLEDGRTYMVVVGAGHLVGPDSVVTMLRAKNFFVEGPH